MADSGGSTTTTSPEATPLQPFDQLTLRALLEQLSSREPIPGGGSAAALAGRPRRRTSVDGGRADRRPDRLGRRCRHARRDRHVGRGGRAARLLALVTLDADAYRSVVEARRLPRVTEPGAGGARAHASTMRPAAPPRLHSASHVRRSGRSSSPSGSCPSAIRTRSATSGVAAHLAAAGVRGALLNVRINLPALGDLRAR